MNNFLKLNYELALNEGLFEDNLISLEQYRRARKIIKQKIDRLINNK